MLSRMHATNRFRKARTTNKDPLRKVTGREPVDPPNEKWGREILECGHKVFPRKDFIGETFPVRRRCAKCGKAGRLP